MGIALRHDGRLVPQEPLHLIQVDPGLNHPRRKGMAKIMEMEIVDLRIVERDGQRPPDIAPIEGRMAFTMEDDINHPWAHRIFMFQEIENGGAHRDRPPLAIF